MVLKPSNGPVPLPNLEITISLLKHERKVVLWNKFNNGTKINIFSIEEKGKKNHKLFKIHFFVSKINFIKRHTLIKWTKGEKLFSNVIITPGSNFICRNGSV